MISKTYIKTQLNTISDFDYLKPKSSFLKIFFYLTRRQREKIESLSYFLQKYHIKLGFLTKKRAGSYRKNFPRFIQINANFIAHSSQLISESDFITINSFLSSQGILVSIVCHNQIWTLSRFLKWHKIVSQTLFLPHKFKKFPLDKTNTYFHNSTQNQFFYLWLFFTLRSF